MKSDGLYIKVSRADRNPKPVQYNATPNLDS